MRRPSIGADNRVHYCLISKKTIVAYPKPLYREAEAIADGGPYLSGFVVRFLFPSVYAHTLLLLFYHLIV